MRKSQRIITTALWSFLVLTMVAVVGRGMWARPGGASAPPAAAELPVWYDAPAFALTDQDGQPFASERLKGQVWVGAFIFTRCAAACPKMTKQMSRLQAAVPAADVRLVSFTVDPERDTPADLKQYARLAGADESRWHFLTGSKQAILDVAAGLKVTAIPAQGGEPIGHEERFLLVDRQGRVRGAYDSKDDERMAQLARDAASLAGATP
jgi:protein SCO1/2